MSTSLQQGLGLRQGGVADRVEPHLLIHEDGARKGALGAAAGIDGLPSWVSAALVEAMAQLAPGGLRVTLTLPAHPRAGHVNVDGQRIAGQFVVWPDGAMETMILDDASERPVYFQTDTVSDVGRLGACFEAFLDAFPERR